MDNIANFDKLTRIMEFSEFLNHILFVIVIYKQKPEETEALSSIERLNKRTSSRVSVFLYDNSPAGNKPEGENLIYRHDPLNNGVAKAYNEAARVALRVPNKKWMLLVDQDTVLNFNYIKKLFDSTQKHKDSVAFVPMLQDHHGMVSPFLWRLGKGKRTTVKGGRLSLDKYRFANSGLLIRCDAFEAVNGYEEKIPLDFSDIAFGEKLKKVTDHFVVVDALLQHSFSGSRIAAKEKALERFGHFCSGAFAMGKNFGPYYVYFIRAFLRSVKLSHVYRNFVFIKKFLQHTKQAKRM